MNTGLTRFTMTAAAVIAGFAVVGAQRPDRTRPPTVGDSPSLQLPSIERTTLSNGVPVWIVESHEVPLVQINLVVLAGSSDDPAERFGVGSLVAAMLDEGAGTRSALDISEGVEYLGATLTTSGSFDVSAVRLNVPVARMQEGLAIMADVALRPTFPQSELERLRKERLTSLLQARDSTSSIAATAFSRLLFGAAHRYGTAGIGTEVSLSALTVDDLRRFHATHFVPSRVGLIVAGDVRASAIHALLEKQFGAWEGAGPPRVHPPAAQPLKQRQLVLIDKPGAAQSHIRIGAVGVARSTPDYFQLAVLNTVFGGSFTSRLNQNLREDHGYTYGASSVFDMRLSLGQFVSAADVQTDKTAEALREFMREFEAIRAPIGAEELSKAKNYLARGFPGEFETISDLSSRMEELFVYGLSEQYLNGYVDRVQAVTAAEVRAAANRYMPLENVLIVVVGDRAAIEPGIQALQLAPVRLMTIAEAFEE